MGYAPRALARRVPHRFKKGSGRFFKKKLRKKLSLLVPEALKSPPYKSLLQSFAPR